MPKLHELLAVFQDKESTGKTLFGESQRVFANQRNLFTGFTKRVEAHDEKRSREFNTEEVSKLTTTVYERLKYTFAKAVVTVLDINASIDRTNGIAKADLIINGKVFVKDVPAITLLSLEKEAKRWLALTQELPTLQSGIPWVLATQQGDHIYTAEVATKKRSEKVSTAVVLYPHSDKHPAQVKEVVNDVPVADITETLYSGMLTPEEKVKIIDRIQAVIDGAKEGRTRANSAEVVELKLGNIIAAWVLDGTEPALA